MKAFPMKITVILASVSAVLLGGGYTLILRNQEIVREFEEAQAAYKTHEEHERRARRMEIRQGEEEKASLMPLSKRTGIPVAQLLLKPAEELGTVDYEKLINENPALVERLSGDRTWEHVKVGEARSQVRWGRVLVVIASILGVIVALLAIPRALGIAWAFLLARITELRIAIIGR